MAIDECKCTTTKQEMRMVLRCKGRLTKRRKYKFSVPTRRHNLIFLFGLHYSGGKTGILPVAIFGGGRVSFATSSICLDLLNSYYLAPRQVGSSS